MKPPIPTDLGWRGFYGWGAGPGDRPRQFALGLFLLSLTALFVASLIGYAWVRTTGPGSHQPVELPGALWGSTLVLLACGVAMTLTQRGAGRSHAAGVRRWLPVAWALSLVFLAIQTPSVIQLARAHEASRLHDLHRAEGLVFTLIILHAAHVMGGLVPLTRLVAAQWAGRLTPNRYGVVRSCAAYWHFLEAVWLTMFGTFLLVG